MNPENHNVLSTVMEWNMYISTHFKTTHMPQCAYITVMNEYNKIQIKVYRKPRMEARSNSHQIPVDYICLYIVSL